MKSILEYNIRIKGVIELGDLVFECTFSRLKVCHEQTICRTFLGMGVLSVPCLLLDLRYAQKLHELKT